ncbi:family A G protein-coupled receptor-like protein [Conidiobolus coronatus NRRL 28638]|uniref:Family A G protein-coupled receptor-like protein n=1 Tax=Conidiobolus coronatus (strain ATCC 28846 / CBS 209.66 / NRRL 28638) TaxID=796925 RepID=A0A137NPQ3_CONC2|nr:family A G protein-coupled receptor-like protein [Conidiobolus coronatus NRRL 28638]|eukprot:KXN64723.1 family A G protein-coupled receptor-like protein [Conidiobolus coronatus NRRL 28638]
MSSPASINEALKLGLQVNLGACGVLGLILNSIVIWVLMRKLKRSNTDIQICKFVAISDTLVSCGLLFRSIFTVYPYNILQVHPNWCKFDALITNQGINCSGIILGIMSIERFLLICYNIKLSIKFWLVLLISIIILCFSLLIVCIINDKQFLTQLEVSCSVKSIGGCYYGFLGTTIFFFAAFTTVVISYVGIMLFKVKQCLNQLNLNIPKDRVYLELRSTLLKSLSYILLYITVFSGKFYTLSYIIITGQNRTLAMDIWQQSLISWSPIANAVILLYMNNEVREAFTNHLKNLKLKVFNLNNY